MHKNSAIIVLLSCLLAVFDAYGQQDWRIPSAESIANYPDTVELYREVAYLADSLHQGRERGGKGHADAAFYIASRLKAAGCTPVSGSYGQAFMVTDSTDLGHNILGILHANGKNTSGRYIIVGAHYDGLGTINGTIYPGADANASGVAAMLEIAATFKRQQKSGYTYNSNIIFVAFDAYMDGREGSKALWNAIAKGKLTDPANGRKILPGNISLMIDLDQVGSGLAPIHEDKPDYLIAIGEHSLPAAWKGILDKCNRFYHTDLDLCKTYYGSANFTDVFYKLGDRKHFIRHGIPTMYFTSGMTPTTNKPEDNAQSLNYELLRKRTVLIFRFIEKTLQF